MPSFFILAPFIAVLILNLPVKVMARSAFWVALTLTVVQAALVVSHPWFYWSAYPDPFGPFFALKLSVDSLSLVMLLSIAIVVFASIVSGRHIIVDESRQFNFISLVLIAMLAMNAVVMTTDLFSLYVFLETSAICLFILIAAKKDKFALEGAFKYLILSAIATVLMLFSIALFVLISGGVSFNVIYGGLGSPASAFLAKLATTLFLCGIFIKSGLVPFHGWLPDAYSGAATPVSVLLAGIVTKVTGVYVLMRLVSSVFILNAQLKGLLLFIGLISIIVGALAALYQRDFKRLLAYSSISQVGYIVLAVGCGTPLALAGAAFHLFNHAVAKSLLFVNACSVENELGTTDMDKMGGLGRRMPVAGASSVIAALSAAGLPPLSGFWSKLIIIIALMRAERPGYAAAALLASVVTLGYMLAMQRKIFFGKPAVGLEEIKESSRGLIFLQVFLALVIIGVGAGFVFVYNNFFSPVESMIF